MSRFSIILIIITIVNLACVICACSSSGTNSEVTNLITGNEWLHELLYLVPNKVEVCRFTNGIDIRNDAYQTKEDAWFPEDYSYYFGPIGTGLESHSDYQVYADGISIFVGYSELEYLQEMLPEVGSKQRELFGTTIWDLEYEGSFFTMETKIGIVGNYPVMFNDDDVFQNWLSFFNSDTPSILEDSCFTELLNRLPNGFYITYSKSTPENNDDDPVYLGSEPRASVLSFKDSNLCVLTAVIKYENTETATNAEQLLTNDWQNDSSTPDIDTHVEDEYLIFVVENSKSEF
ncbi:MAG: hypothetical protein GY865_13090 [candidate division Zixibacteria bacterium]|nr:hypothetical protein [candidate division Zixibacteria bacterium]